MADFVFLCNDQAARACAGRRDRIRWKDGLYYHTLSLDRHSCTDCSIRDYACELCGVEIPEDAQF